MLANCHTWQIRQNLDSWKLNVTRYPAPRKKNEKGKGTHDGLNPNPTHRKKLKALYTPVIVPLIIDP